MYSKFPRKKKFNKKIALVGLTFGNYKVLLLAPNIQIVVVPRSAVVNFNEANWRGVHHRLAALLQ